ncbi:hypothetical protein PR048_028053 [Dryococelus australis]|uniref:Uncharacterized protein n=1 Tax=Dryococelus australis TaxID=614101 RepID=A0ABQ9GI72_9NEOP|nr:hypothetical protein PR048_028053 [Dryococelus australis]
MSLPLPACVFTGTLIGMLPAKWQRRPVFRRCKPLKLPHRRNPTPSGLRRFGFSGNTFVVLQFFLVRGRTVFVPYPEEPPPPPLCGLKSFSSARGSFIDRPALPRRTVPVSGWLLVYIDSASWDTDCSSLRNLFNPYTLSVPPPSLARVSARAIRVILARAKRAPSPLRAGYKTDVQCSLSAACTCGTFSGDLIISLMKMGIVPDDVLGWRVFSGVSHFPRPFISALLHTSITLIGSQDLDVKRRPNLFTHSNILQGLQLSCTHPCPPLGERTCARSSSLRRFCNIRGRRSCSRSNVSLRVACAVILPLKGSPLPARARLSDRVGRGEPSTFRVDVRHNSECWAVSLISAPSTSLLGLEYPKQLQRYSGNTARIARRSDEALGVRVSVVCIAPSHLDIVRGCPMGLHPTLNLYDVFHACSPIVQFASSTLPLSDTRSRKLPVHWLSRCSSTIARNSATHSFIRFNSTRGPEACGQANYQYHIEVVLSPHINKFEQVSDWLTGSDECKFRVVIKAITKANRVQSPAGSPDFRKWESCRTMPLVGGFPRGSPVSPAPLFRCRSIFTSITLIGSEDLAVKSRPNIFTRSIRAMRSTSKRRPMN